MDNPQQVGGTAFHGSTWQIVATPNPVGSLLVEMRVDVPIVYLSMFQMESDGRCTAVRVCVHASENIENPPEIDDDAWVPATPWISLKAFGPKVAKLRRPVCARFLRVDCTNDGQFGMPTCIELHGLKGFGASAASVLDPLVDEEVGDL